MFNLNGRPVLSCVLPCPVCVFLKMFWSYFLSVSELPAKTTFLVIIGLKMLYCTIHLIQHFSVLFVSFNNYTVCLIHHFGPSFESSVQ